MLGKMCPLAVLVSACAGRTAARVVAVTVSVAEIVVRRSRNIACALVVCMSVGVVQLQAQTATYVTAITDAASDLNDQVVTVLPALLVVGITIVGFFLIWRIFKRLAK